MPQPGESEWGWGRASDGGRGDGASGGQGLGVGVSWADYITGNRGRDIKNLGTTAMFPADWKGKSLKCVNPVCVSPPLRATSPPAALYSSSANWGKRTA